MSADDIYNTFWNDETERVYDINWPDGMNYLLFDFDAQAAFSDVIPTRCEFGIWQTSENATIKSAEENDDFKVRLGVMYPLAVYIRREETRPTPRQ